MKTRSLLLGVMALLALAAGLLLAQATGGAQAPLADLDVIKSVEPALIAPGQVVAYQILLTNNTDTTIDLSALADTLPDGFVYGGLSLDSEWGQEPGDTEEPLIQWTGPIPVPALDSLLVSYWVYVPSDIPLSPDPYTNTAVATWSGGSSEGSADLLVAIGEVSLQKTAFPARVKPGGAVTYTVSFSNSGYTPEPLEEVTDQLPPGVTFVGMTPGSDISTPPQDSNGTLTWPGPLTIPTHDNLVFEYRTTMPSTEETLYLENLAQGRQVDQTVIMDTAEVVVSASGPTIMYMPVIAQNFTPPLLTGTKTAEPPSVLTAPGEKGEVTYTLTFQNVGTSATPAIVERIEDTLPAGFTFLSMASGSDVQDNPSGTTGKIVWQGPFEMPSGSTLTLIYRVQTGNEWGQFTNSAVPVMQQGAPPDQPVSATVNVRSASWLDQDFNDNNQGWEPFLNYWRLRPEQWVRENGYMRHAYYFGVADPLRGAHDALYMYRGEYSETWTDYSYEARLNLVDGEQIGVWFRGTYDGSTDGSGQKVTGYYLVLRPKGTHAVRLSTLRTEEECYDDCVYGHIYHFSNPYVIAEVVGQDALAQLGIFLQMGRWHTVRIEAVGNRIKVYVDGHLAIDYLDTIGTQFMNGTVGFFTYKAADARFDDVKVRPLP